MDAEAVYENIAKHQVSLAVLAGILLAAVLLGLTVLFHVWKAIDLLASVTEIWLFFVLLPGLTIAFTLIVHGLSKPKSRQKPELTELKSGIINLVLPDDLVALQREQLPKLYELFPKASHEIIVIAATLEFIARFSPEVLLKSIKDNVKVTLIVLNPNNKKLMEQLPSEFAWTGLKKMIDLALDELCALKKISGSTIELRVFNHIPFTSMILIDPYHGNEGIIEYSPHLRRVSPYGRLSVLINKKTHSELFARYLAEYEMMADNSEPYPCPEYLDSVTQVELTDSQILILKAAQGYYPSTIPTLTISNLIKLNHQTVLAICRNLSAREFLELKEINGHALVRITSRGQKALGDAD